MTKSLIQNGHMYLEDMVLARESSHTLPKTYSIMAALMAAAAG